MHRLWNDNTDDGKLCFLLSFGRVVGDPAGGVEMRCFR